MTVPRLCPSCQLYAMPGAACCGRCGTMLDWSHVPAPQMSARALIAVPKGATAASTYGERWRWQRQQALAELRRLAPVAWGAVVPGQTEWQHGSRLWGGGLFAMWCLLLLVPLTTPLHGWSQAAVVCPAIVHCASIGRWLRTQCETLLAAACAVVLQAFITLPFYGLLYVVSQFVLIESPAHRVGILHSGDLLLCAPLAKTDALPKVGTYIAYGRQRPYVLYGDDPRGIVVLKVPTTGVERVLALPGQHVKWDGRELRVEGQRPIMPPHAKLMGRDTWSMQVPADAVLVSMCEAAPDDVKFFTSPPVAHTAALLPVAEVRGTVGYRYWPPTRWGAIE